MGVKHIVSSISTQILSLFLCINFLITYSQTETLSINIEKSNVKWYGDEITGKQHYGSLKLKKGEIILSGTGKYSDKIISGNFTVDMTSLNVEDLSGRSKSNLQGHLKSDDFFSVDRYKNAFLKILKGNEPINGIQTLQGDLTIKGKTHPVCCVRRKPGLTTVIN